MLWFLALGVSGLLIAPFGAVQIQERIFRHRAEQLLADMRLLMMHKAELPEIRAVFERWHPSEEHCDSYQCWFRSDISYGPFTPFLDYSYVPDIAILQAPHQSKLWLVPFRIYGGRQAHIRARAYVERGVMYGLDYRIDLEISALPEDYSNVKETQQQYILSAAAGYVWRFSILADWHGLTLHPDYFIEEGAPPRGEVRSPDVFAEFGPGADLGDVSRLADFDFSCLARLMPCRKPEDIMPQAAAQFAKEEPQLVEARKNHVCSPNVVALMARDAGRAGVVEVTGSRSEPHFSEVPVPIVRLLQDFEPARGWKTGETRELLILDPNTGRAVRSLPPEVRPGNRLIMLAESDLPVSRLAETYSCGVVGLTPANLELVQNAIAGNLPPAKP
jgi:hypothetical protein